MTLPFALPDWVPWWVPLVLLVPALLYALAFLFMPFSVIGVKGRLDGLETRLDEIQHDLRLLVLRLPETTQHVEFDEIYHSEPAEPARRAPIVSRPPIPPAAHELDSGGAGADHAAPSPNARPGRREPRLDWPR